MQSVRLTCQLSAISIFLSEQTKNQPTIILSHNKLAPAASHRLMISISISTPKKCEEEKKNGR
jgi:hypothetical protein